jgi:hypothetical protein
MLNLSLEEKERRIGLFGTRLGLLEASFKQVLKHLVSLKR